MYNSVSPKYLNIEDSGLEKVSTIVIINENNDSIKDDI